MPADDLVAAVKQRKLEIDCAEMSLKQDGVSEPVIYRGAGYIRQLDDDTLSFTLYPSAMENANPFGALRDMATLSAGSIIPADHYYSLTALAMDGEEWTADRIRPSCNWLVSTQQATVKGPIWRLSTVREHARASRPSGTGTFVKLGNVYGILTAGHVLGPIGTNEVVGLVRFPGIQPLLQNFRLNMGYAERVVLWDGSGGHAPDIAFLKIPEIDGRRLEAAGAVFYNLGLAREFEPAKPGHRISKCHAVVGVIGEWTEEGSATAGKGKKVEVGGLFGVTKDLREFKEEGVALMEVTVDHAAGPKVPESYGGVSGGGLWELNVELDDKLRPIDVKKKLAGVAFRQSDDHKRITSNAFSSIEAITEEIRKKWPADQ